jgi:phospholipid transport system substrate-binding protein
MRRRDVLAIVGLAMAVPFAPMAARADTTPGPVDVIRAFCDQLIDIMRNAKTLGPTGRYQRFEPIVHKNFDLPFMTKLAVGPLWGRLPPDQKEQAWKAFGRYFTAQYASRFDGYSGEQFKLLGDQKIKHGMLVRTQLVKTDGETVSINYFLHDNDIAWQIRDVYVAGSISELATRRSEFAAILRNQGLEGLVAALNKKADQFAG